MAFDAVLAERLRDLVQGEPGLSEKRMFGGLAFLVHGNMAVAASSQGGLLLRIDPADAESLTATRTRAASRCAAGRWTAGCGWTRRPSSPTS